MARFGLSFFFFLSAGVAQAQATPTPPERYEVSAALDEPPDPEAAPAHYQSWTDPGVRALRLDADAIRRAYRQQRAVGNRLRTYVWATGTTMVGLLCTQVFFAARLHYERNTLVPNRDRHDSILRGTLVVGTLLTAAIGLFVHAARKRSRWSRHYAPLAERYDRLLQLEAATVSSW